MRAIIDTNIAILLRDDERRLAGRVTALDNLPLLSILSRVELEGGVYRDVRSAPFLRARLDTILTMFEQVPFTEAEAEIYGRIVESCGFSRPRIIDRMIAATAIARDATLITLNPGDFAGIPGLAIDDWTLPLE